VDEQLDELDVFPHAEHRPRCRSSLLRAARAVVFSVELSKTASTRFDAGEDLVDELAAAVLISSAEPLFISCSPFTQARSIPRPARLARERAAER
jgi:hypothetical protein